MTTATPITMTCILETLAERKATQGIAITQYTKEQLWSTVSLSDLPEAIKGRHFDRIKAL